MTWEDRLEFILKECRDLGDRHSREFSFDDVPLDPVEEYLMEYHLFEEHLFPEFHGNSITITRDCHITVFDDSPLILDEMEAIDLDEATT